MTIGEKHHNNDRYKLRKLELREGRGKIDVTPWTGATPLSTDCRLQRVHGTENMSIFHPRADAATATSTLTENQHCQ